MRLSLWLWVTLFGVCMAVMLWYGRGKTIVIADLSQDEADLRSGQEEDDGGRNALILQQEDGAPGCFRVPIPKGVKPEQVVIENRYTDRELWICIQSQDPSVYGETPVSGDVSRIREGFLQVRESDLLLRLKMDGVMEYRSTMEGNGLTVECYDPHEAYEYLVVLDPAGGGNDGGTDPGDGCGEELPLEVAKRVQRCLDMPEVKVYLTRSEDVEVSEQDRVGLWEALHADLYIRLSVSADEGNPDLYGILGYYNEEYFIPGFGNVQLADAVTRQTAIASSNLALGLRPAGEDSILLEIAAPAAELSLGYLSNPKERALMQKEDYRDRLAAGIAAGIREACEKLDGLSRAGER